MSVENYLADYQNKKLNEIVIPGAHDAGIYGAGMKTNVQTQELNIGDQARAGCRFFDMRIATHKTKVNGHTVYRHQAYHLDGSLVKNNKIRKWHSSPGRDGIKSWQNVSHAGGWGDGLVSMLRQAKAFVQGHGTEFLILKFSKCRNWQSVAQTVIAELDGVHYMGAGNLNTTTIGDMAGTVITVFDESARAKLGPYGSPHADNGILFCKALYDKDSGKSSGYDPAYIGLQYFGKFSSTDNVDKNTAKQLKTLSTGSGTHVDALGMMYWTTTGLLGNIRTRNTGMWTPQRRVELYDTWAEALREAIEAKMGREYENALRLAMTTGGIVGGRLKAFMPNIVMMDFVDSSKCRTIKGLNTLATIELSKLILPPAPTPQPAPQI